MNRVVILGASRGLGAELAKIACSAGVGVTGISRKKALLESLALGHREFEFRVADFSRAEGQDETLQYLVESKPARVFCVAGGGPFGAYHERSWKDHEWALQVSFLFPARVAHTLREASPSTQIVFVGSSVAESSADPQAASYCAAKHALKGLFSTLRSENPGWDIRLFSPGYMDTDMLPKNAAVRSNPSGIWKPSQVASDLWSWSLGADKSGHKLYPAHPS